MTTDLMSEKVVLVHRGEQVGQDSLHKPIYGPSTEEAVPGWVDTVYAPEMTDFRTLRIIGYTLYLDGVHDLSSTDTVKYGGETFQIDGEPLKQAGGLTLNSYTQCSLKNTKG